MQAIFNFTRYLSDIEVCNTYKHNKQAQAWARKY